MRDVRISKASIVSRGVIVLRNVIELYIMTHVERDAT